MRLPWSGYTKIDFFEGKVVFHVLAKEALYELTPSWDLIPFKLSEDIKINQFGKAVLNENYWCVSFPSHLDEGGRFYTKTTILFVDKDKNVHSFVVKSATRGLFVGSKYYVCSANTDVLMGEEPHIIDLSNWTMYLLDNIRTEPYKGILGANFGSDPSGFFPVSDNEVLFYAENTTALNSNSLFQLQINEKPDQYKLSLSTYGDGILSRKTGLCSEGEAVEVEAIPKAGYYFAGWRGSASGRLNPLKATMDEDKILTAFFLEEEDEYNLTITTIAEQGTVTPGNGKHRKDAHVEIKATPKAGYHFMKWTGDYESTDNPFTIQIKGHASVIAIFESISTAITDVSETNRSSIYPNPVKDVLHIKVREGSENLMVEVYNLFGELMMKREVVDEKISVAHLEKGIYLIKLKKGTMVQTFKLKKI